jgi:hypothetical protein
MGGELSGTHEKFGAGPPASIPLVYLSVPPHLTLLHLFRNPTWILLSPYLYFAATVRVFPATLLVFSCSPSLQTGTLYNPADLGFEPHILNCNNH